LFENVGGNHDSSDVGGSSFFGGGSDFVPVGPEQREPLPSIPDGAAKGAAHAAVLHRSEKSQLRLIHNC